MTDLSIDYNLVIQDGPSTPETRNRRAAAYTNIRANWDEAWPWLLERYKAVTPGTTEYKSLRYLVASQHRDGDWEALEQVDRDRDTP